MAKMTVRATYALDIETVRRLEHLARRWNVSKSEVLRRAIRAAGDGDSTRRSAVAALDRLQRAVRLTNRRARDWARAARVERRHASKRREAPTG